MRGSRHAFPASSPTSHRFSSAEFTMINADWHQRYPMPMGSTLSQRVQWHVAHAKACGCRPVPPTVLKELRRLGRKPPKRRVGSTTPGGRLDLCDLFIDRRQRGRRAPCSGTSHAAREGSQRASASRKACAAPCERPRCTSQARRRPHRAACGTSVRSAQWAHDSVITSCTRMTASSSWQRIGARIRASSCGPASADSCAPRRLWRASSSRHDPDPSGPHGSGPRAPAGEEAQNGPSP